MKNWQTPAGSIDVLQQQFGKAISLAEFNGQVKLPDLRKAQSLAIAMDYAGEHQASAYQCLAFLLADGDSILGHWDSARRKIRQEVLGDARRHAFKKLSEPRRQQALGPFLEAASALNGIVFCVAFDKRLESTTLGYEFTEKGSLKPLVFAKLVKIALFGSLLVGGLATTDQSLAWITDDDEIVSNAAARLESASVIHGLLHRMCPFGLTKVSLEIASGSDEGFTEDLCSIPDLVGGAVSEYLNSIDVGSLPKFTNLQTLLWNRVATKTNCIMAWLASEQENLAVVFCLVRDHPDGLSFSFASPTLAVGDLGAEPLWLPPDKGWPRAIKSWRK